MISRWTKKEDVAVNDARIFKLKRATYRRDEGKGKSPVDRDYYYLDTGDWINIVPITPDRKVILIRQFRAGMNDVFLETPGGMVDGTDKTPLEAARREMLEETGYDSNNIEPIGKAHPNPAIQNNAIWFFVARDARRRGPQNLEPGEDIELEVVNLTEIDRLIDTGRISHALVLNAFDFLKRKHPEYWR